MARIAEQTLEYSVDGARHVGFFAVDEARPGVRPGVLVVHEWWGVNDYIRGRTRQLAELGYAALAIDMYGGGKSADNPEQAAALMNGVLGDMTTGTARLAAGYATLLAQPQVDADRSAAIGYCFGGAMVLHMARIGMPLNAVVSFHGALGSFHKPGPGEVKARVLVCHGGADKLVTMHDLDALRAELDAAGADYEVIVYPDALHGFTNPQATARGQQYGMPLAHDAAADAQSWQAMQELFSRALAP
jgi:dienelactone hydrolase